MNCTKILLTQAVKILKAFNFEILVLSMEKKLSN